ncbi:MAG: SusC/RagA family TonB-linked outer membrane protein [Flavobacteriales bacterium 32-35-8]|nr:MAG: SusC/RagA family TonB-linked outer membrane protein [Flavobacteriales bacterium 32-35-8]
MKRHKQKKTWLSVFYLSLGFLLVSFTSYAQNITVSGKVTSSDGLPLLGANILVKNTSQGTLTDFDGNYSINNVNPQGTLIFSYLGFIAQEVPIANKTVLNITMNEDTESLNEVVVIGYGTVKKSDLTGAVSSIKAEDLNPGANASIDQALQGRIAGVQISQKSNEPGGGLSISIRGAGSIQAGTEPLYVIDGVIVNNGSVAATGGAGFTGNQNPRNPLNSLNPTDIASIEVLKDASSTAIYGSRGSNGVVLITTKTGKQGKLKVNYDYYAGFQETYERLDILTPTEYRDVLNAIIADGGGDPGQVISEIQGSGTDWQDLIFQSAPIANHNLSFSGGNDKSSYFASLNYFDQDGLVKGSGVKRYSARVNLNYNEPQKYKYGVNINTSYIGDDYASTGVGINENGGALYSAINYDPTVLPFDENGNYYRNLAFLTIDNPLSILNGQDARSETFRFVGSTFLEYNIIPDLSAKIQLGGDVQDVRRDAFVQPYTIAGQGTGGIASIQTGRRDYVSIDGTLNYNKAFGDDNLTVTAVSSYEYFQTKSFSGDGRGFALPDLGTNAIGSGDPTLNNIGSGRTQARFISYLGRINYSLNNKYLFTASFRADGSSRFGDNNKFGYFPSGAFGWKMHEESFMKNSNTINELKLRLSAGITGNANIGNSLAFQTFSPGGNLLFGNDFYNTIFPSRISNPNLTWEKAVQYDAGIDFGLFKNKISGSIDYFYKETTDLLVNIPQPLNTGFTGQVQNLGGVSNQGLELTLNITPVRTENFTWDISGNLATLKNEVLDIGDRGDIIRGALAQIPDFSIITPGEALDSYYGFIVDGVWQTNDDFSITEPQVRPGDVKYRDINGDGAINANDRVIIGSPIPKMTWGLVNNFKYKDFSLDIVFQGVEGVDRLNGNLLNTYSPNNFRRNRMATPLLNRWTVDNPTNQYPSFVNPGSQGGTNAFINTRTVEDASYIRLQSVRLGYNVPIQNLNIINKLSVYVTGQNLFTITDYSGVDPAANASGSNTIAIDFNAYPVPRTFLLGLNVEF